MELNVENLVNLGLTKEQAENIVKHHLNEVNARLEEERKDMLEDAREQALQELEDARADANEWDAYSEEERQRYGDYSIEMGHDDQGQSPRIYCNDAGEPMGWG